MYLKGEHDGRGFQHRLFWRLMLREQIFKGCLCYRVSSRSAWLILWGPVSKFKMNKRAWDAYSLVTEHLLSLWKVPDAISNKTYLHTHTHVCKRMHTHTHKGICNPVSSVLCGYEAGISHILHRLGNMSSIIPKWGGRVDGREVKYGTQHKTGSQLSFQISMSFCTIRRQSEASRP